MTELAVLARISTDGDFPVERLVCHPRLPLAVGAAADSRAVRVLDCGEGRLRELAVLDVEPGSTHWDTSAPQAAAWHPDEPVLVVADGESLLRWSAGAPSEPVRTPAAGEYRSLAFSPDGGRLWATPSGDGDWERSDVVDPATGAVTGSARGWDTGVGAHPSGELVSTLISDQGATFCLFARPGEGPGAAMRPLRDALILDCDGYDAPLFSADGRHLAIRGNAYVDSLDVFAFPALRKVLSTTLSEGRAEEWPHHNLAWDARPGVLWIGTPTGSLLELDVEAQEFTEHTAPDGVPVAALAGTANGELLVARADGELLLLAVRPDAAAVAAPNDDVAAFLAGTREAPLDGELEPHLVFTDGTGVWTDDDLASVTEASPADPTWLQIQATVNRLRDA